LLKFSSSVRVLIVYGTEIRKDKLTEDQLMPLKDLPMEYRDSLALIMAADEMLVPDVKRIAKLFKDKEISESTKGKLLFKTGPQLLETWSTFEHNKKERAKSAEPKEEPGKSHEEPVRGKAENKERVLRPESSFAGLANLAQATLVMDDLEATVLEANRDSDSDEDIELQGTSSHEEQPSESLIEGMMNLLFASLPAPISFTPSDLPDLIGVEREQFVRDVDSLIGDLEKHLAEWRAVKDRMQGPR
jgi:ParB family chromosome partitioning protein